MSERTPLAIHQSDDQKERHDDYVRLRSLSSRKIKGRSTERSITNKFRIYSSIIVGFLLFARIGQPIGFFDIFLVLSVFYSIIPKLNTNQTFISLYIGFYKLLGAFMILMVSFIIFLFPLLIVVH